MPQIPQRTHALIFKMLRRVIAHFHEIKNKIELNRVAKSRALLWLPFLQQNEHINSREITSNHPMRKTFIFISEYCTHKTNEMAKSERK